MLNVLNLKMNTSSIHIKFLFDLLMKRDPFLTVKRKMDSAISKWNYFLIGFSCNMFTMV